MDENQFTYNEALLNVTEFYEKDSKSVRSPNGGNINSPLDFVLKLPRNVISCLGVLMTFLKDFQRLNQVFNVITNFRSFTTANHMLLNGTTLVNLEVLVNSSTFEDKGSLFWVMNHTSTAFGKRLLKRWITQPLIDIAKIRERQDAVEELATGNSNQSVTALFALLKCDLPDLERVICRIHFKKCTTHEFYRSLQSFKKVAQTITSLSHLRSPMLSTLVKSFPPIEKFVDYFLRCLSQEAAKNGDLAELFANENEFPSIPSEKEKIKKVHEELEDHLKDVQQKMKNPSLKYLHMPKLNIEYLIEVPHTKSSTVPPNWVKINATKEKSRYQTTFIIEKMRNLAIHKENLNIACQHAWLSFLGEFAERYVDFREAVNSLAILDCLCSLAVLAKNPSYTKPNFTEVEQQLSIQGGRHPVVETMMPDNYVSNDTNMLAYTTAQPHDRCMIITGPNMGGKSSYIRQIALIIVMAQVGSYVPATAVTLSSFDAVYTRMGAEDNIEKGQSTFFVELQETSTVLKAATKRSLVILDELGRGTSTHDGVAIAYATLQYLVEKLGCLSLFVTHYPLLAQLEVSYPGVVANYHMAFLEEEDEQDKSAPKKVTFLYKVTRGAAKSSYGLNVARLAGISYSILKEATERSEELKHSIAQRAFSNSFSPKDALQKVIKLLESGGQNEEVAKELASLQKAARNLADN